jgi:hypothetical protein
MLFKWKRTWPMTYARNVTPFAAELECMMLFHFQNPKSTCPGILLQTTSRDSLPKLTRENYAIQHRNNPCRHRDPLRLADLYHWRAAGAGRSYSSRAGDYFRRKRVPSRLVGDNASPAFAGYGVAGRAVTTTTLIRRKFCG